VKEGLSLSGDASTRFGVPKFSIIANIKIDHPNAIGWQHLLNAEEKLKCMRLLREVFFKTMYLLINILEPDPVCHICRLLPDRQIFFIWIQIWF
jgi:hypothetical protein